MKRFFLFGLALLAAVYAGFSMLRNHTSPEHTEPPLKPPVSDFLRTVAAVGLVESSTENIAIGTPLAGIVEKVFVEVGQKVKAGEPLFQLDIRNLTAELDVRRAELAMAGAREHSAETALEDENDRLQRAERLTQGSVISTDELARRKFAVETAQRRLEETRAESVTAEAQLRATETEIERSTVRAPIDGTVLQLKIRAGEFAPASQTSEPLLVMGGLQPLHVRVDVDEQEAWRVRPRAPAVAHVRGNPDIKTGLKFVRFEPMVVPKRSLTGDSVERVDTRVLEIIYEVTDPKVALFIGQQMDVFIEQIQVPPAGL